MTGISLNHLPHHTYVPRCLVRYAVYFPKFPVERTVLFDSQRNNCFSIPMEALGSARKRSIWRKILTGFSIRMESALHTGTNNLVFCFLNWSSRWVSLFLQMVLEVCRMKARICEVLGVQKQECHHSRLTP